VCSEAKEVLENSILPLSLTLNDVNVPEGATEFMAWEAALAADLKLLVDGS
jgi:hypothetical protein